MIRQDEMVGQKPHSNYGNRGPCTSFHGNSELPLNDMPKRVQYFTRYFHPLDFPARVGYYYAHFKNEETKD